MTPTIQSEIELLQNTKSELKYAIMEKGVFVNPTDTFSLYPTRIGQISMTPGTNGNLMASIIDKSVTSITIPNGTTRIRQELFIECADLASVNFPNTLTEIANDAFHYCTSLTSITIPSSVTFIGYGAFASCTGLASITVEAVSPPTLQPYSSSTTTFDNTNDCPIYVPTERVNVYKQANGWSKYASRIQAIPTYKARLTLTDNSVVTIDDDGSGELTSEELYPYQSTLRELEVFSYVNTITDSACNRFTALTTVTLDNSVTTLEGYAFNRCTSLTSFTAPGLTSWGQQALFQSAMTYYEIPEGITTNVFATFGQSPYLEEVVFPEGFLEVGDSDFMNCNNLITVTLPDSVTSIGPSAFDNCTSLTSINIPSGVTDILPYTFRNCTSLTSIDIPSSVTSIGDSAFYGCTSLTSIDIPSSVTSIMNYAFYGCTSLQSITCLATTPPDLIYNPLDYTNDCPIYVPADSVEVYKLAWSLYADRIQAIIVPSKMIITYDNSGIIETISIPEDHICEDEEMSYPTTIKACDYDELFASLYPYPEGIRTITIGENVEIIELSLWSCIGLESITIEATTPPEFYDDIFDPAETNDCPIYVPTDSLQDYLDDPNWGGYYSSRLEAIPEPVVPKFVRIAETTDATDGKYLIVDMTSSMALNASLITSTTNALNGINKYSSGNTISVTIEPDGTITANAENLNAAAYYDATNQKLYWENGNNVKYYLSQYRTTSTNFKYTSPTTVPTTTITPYKGNANYITLKQSYCLGGDGNNTVSWYDSNNATEIGRVALFKYVEE